MAKLGKPGRAVLLWAALGLTLAAALWFKDEPDSALVEEAARPAMRSESRAQNPPAHELSLALPERRANPAPAEDAFKSQSWAPPAPPPPPSPSVKASPSAPPLPFSYLGRMEQDGQIFVFLAKQDRNYVVKAGEVLDGAYRLEEVQPGALSFTYLPLKLKQSLHLREGS